MGRKRENWYNSIMKKILIVLTSLFLLSSCVSYETLRSENRNNLSKITLGLSINEVTMIMGEKESGLPGNEIFKNPYLIETIEHKGNNYLIYYYYTNYIGEKSWETGVTPIIFLNNKVVGINWRSMEKLELDSPSKKIRVR
jgi:hypothetical protein